MYINVEDCVIIWTLCQMCLFELFGWRVERSLWNTSRGTQAI